MKYPQPETVRWFISEYVRKHVAACRPPVLEVGSRREDYQWWRDLRAHCGIDDWTGLDISKGPNVDVVLDITGSVPGDMVGTYNTIVCAEVLEHVRNPAGAIQSMFDLLAPGGALIITVPFAFPVHNFPNDYWRFAPNGLRMILGERGFTDIDVATFNIQTVTLRDHDERETIVTVPTHVGANCKKPER